MARKNDGPAGCIAAVIVIAVVLLAIFWPYVVAVWLVESAGGSDDSLTARVLGSLFEAVYLAIVAIVVIGRRYKKEAQVSSYGRSLALADVHSDIRAAEARIALLESVQGVMRSGPAGEPDERIPARESLLMELRNVDLVEPRVQQRGAVPWPVAVRNGSLLVSDRAFRHVSAQGRVEWRLANIYEQSVVGTDMITWGVTNRQKVSGVGGSPAVVDAVQVLGAWAEDYPAPPDRALALLADLLRDAKGRLEDRQTELARVHARKDQGADGAVGTLHRNRGIVAGVVGVLVFGGMLGVMSASASGDSSQEATDSSADDSSSGVDPSRPAKPEPSKEPKELKYLVSHVGDGDTVRLRNGEVVRLVGIDAPEVGECGHDKASDLLTDLVEGRLVSLTEADEDRDKYDRLLRYVDVGGLDVGLRLIKKGLAIARYDSRDGYGRHPRQKEYVAADRASKAFTCAPPPPPPTPKPPKHFADPPSSNCASGYSPCIPAYPPDLDCADVDGPIYVTGSDPHGLDADNDGVACE
ncbi:thermonuclease family protein [Nocardioides sp. MH1]|uniref:thermonuclease family protein n=1 Tax=Nocardioides sp. MH1 TaxID=3242490 RepID=UPI00352254B0